MHKEHDGTASLIDVMDAVALDLHKVALERIELLVEPLGMPHRLLSALLVVRNRDVYCRHRIDLVC
jgi:hypothetical protein